MMGSAVKIDFDDPAEGIPAFLTILAHAHCLQHL